MITKRYSITKTFGESGAAVRCLTPVSWALSRKNCGSEHARQFLCPVKAALPEFFDAAGGAHVSSVLREA